MIWAHTFATALAAGLVLSATMAGAGIVSRHTGVWTEPPRLVPTNSMPDGPLLGNGDVGVVVAGPPDEMRFHIGKNDFWTRKPGDASIITVGTVAVRVAGMAGATYHLEQDMARAEAVGRFATARGSLHTTTRVDANRNLLVTSLRCDSAEPLTVSVRQVRGEWHAGAARVALGDALVNLGREQHGGGRWYFDGALDSVRVLDRALPPAEIQALAASRPGHEEAMDGRSTWRVVEAPAVDRAVTVEGWIRIASTSPEANYIVSKGDWDQAYSLGLSNGKLRWTVNGAAVQSEQPLPHNRWLHVAGTYSGGALQAYVDGRPLSPDDGAAGTGPGLLWFSRKADSLPGRARAAAVATRLVGADNALVADGVIQATLRPGRTAYVISAILSDLDAPDPVAAARRMVSTPTPEGLGRMEARHRQWWSRYWSRSFIEIPDKEIEKRWYAALYVLGSCSRAGKVAPGLWGNWVTTDHPNWHGDFHLNYNFQAPYYLAYSSNHADLTLPFYQAIAESMENGRAMARRHGWKGVHFPVSIGPWGLSPEDPDGDWGQRSNAAFAALNFIWYSQYTRDPHFARQVAYPYLLEVAAFWEDYLRLEGGRYVIHSDSIHEGSGPDVNPILSLGLLRTLFSNLVSMSEELGLDSGRRAHWQDILDRLSPFPTQQRDGVTVFRYSERGMAWCDGNTLGIHHIFPCGAIGLDSDARLLETSRNMVPAMARWADYNGFASWYTACARIGFDPGTILARMRAECNKHSLPNLLLYYGGGGIESAGGFLAINEMMLQGHEGVLRLFPCWPRNLDARFGRLRARGAFLVSAQLRAGKVGSVRVMSERGEPCRMVNPWPGSTVRLARPGGLIERLEGERFTFATSAGETVRLAPTQ